MYHESKATLMIENMKRTAQHYPDKCKLQFGGDSVHTIALDRNTLMRVIALAEMGDTFRRLQQKAMSIPRNGDLKQVLELGDSHYDYPDADKDDDHEEKETP